MNNSNDREVRKAYRNLETSIDKSKQIIEKCQADLEQEFNRLNQIINTYEEKKQQNQANYSQNLQSLIGELGNLAIREMGITEKKVQQKNASWEVLERKMEIYYILRQKMKEMFKIGKQGGRQS